jgi:hypothetical protein
MPFNAFLLFLFFAAAAVVIGAAVGWAVGPRRPAVAILPIVAAFGALYVLGHRSGLHLGPTVLLLGFEVNLFWDLGVAVVAAAFAAIAQCAIVSRRRRGSVA